MQADVKTGMVQNKKSAVVFRLLLILIEIKNITILLHYHLFGIVN